MLSAMLLRLIVLAALIFVCAARLATDFSSFLKQKGGAIDERAAQLLADQQVLRCLWTSRPSPHVPACSLLYQG